MVQEYLPILSIFRKWISQSSNFKIGDLLIIETKDTPRSNWPLGRIKDIKEGSNNTVRVVRLKTSSGETVRPVSQVALLEKNQG